MFDLPPIVFSVLAIVLGLGLYAFSWWVLRDLPLGLKILGRVLMVFVVLLPFALLVTRYEATAPNGGGGAPVERYTEPDDAKKREDSKPSTGTSAPDVVEKNGEGAGGSAAPKIQEESAKEETTAEEAVTGGDPVTTSEPEEPEPPPPPKPEPEASEERSDVPKNGAPAANGAAGDDAAPESERTRSLAKRRKPAGTKPGTPTVAAAEKKNEDWDVVPVYFGTDRARQPSEKRLEYNANRARRLELGRAMVSVPRVHQIPSIERPWKITIPYFNVTVYEEAEDPKKHFTMQEIKSMTEEQMMALVRERIAASQRFKDHALVFIHGYNTSFDLAVYRTAQIAYDLKFDGAPFVYSWPSGGNVASYTYDLGSAAQSEPFLREFLTLVSQKSGAKKISVIAHSMGNQPLLRVLQDFTRTSPPGIKIDQLILAAPDVDRDTFENIASTLQPLADGITLYAAANDRALDASESFHRSPRAGDVPEGGPVILSGMDTIDVSAISMDGLGLRHSGYAENNKLLQDIGRLIETGARPPNVRVPALETIDTDKGAYWRYPAVP